MRLRRLLCLFTLLLCGIPARAQFLKLESFEGRDVVAGEILVKFRDASEPQSRTLLARDADIAEATPVGSSGAMRVRSANRDVATLLQAYRTRLDVVYAEPNVVWHAYDLPNDAYFNQQWGLRNTGQLVQGSIGTSRADINAASAWDITEGSRSFVIAVVDTGVDYNHPDLAANIWSAPSAYSVTVGGRTINCAAGTHGFNAILKTCDPMDDESHGTHVSGILGASGNNGAGVSGVARVASIMGLKFLDATGSGSTADAIDALDFALKVKATFPSAANIRILNNSWGSTFNSLALRDEISLIQASDMLFLAAAGNSSRTNDLVPDFPASYDLPNVVSVAATDSRDALASFSNWGTTTVALGAPGVNILSTVPSGVYAFLSGTSMATPVVSGAAALVLSACPLNTSQLRSALLSSVDPITALTGKTTTGGRLNVGRAVSTCFGAAQPAFRISVNPGTQTVAPGGTVNLAVTAVALGGFASNIDLSSTPPAGITAVFQPSVLTGSGTSVLTLTAAAGMTPGAYSVPVRATSGSLSANAGVLLSVGPAVSVGQTMSGTLAVSDQASPGFSGRYADFYRLTLGAATPLVIDLKSRVFDTYLNVYSATGSVLFSSNDDAGDGNSRITTTLGAGSYSIEVTSNEDGGLGPYSLSVITPTIEFLSPPAGVPGAVVNVTLTGTRFTAPVTINAGAGIAVSNVVVVSPSVVTAVFTVAADSATGVRDVSVTTAEGTSNTFSFTVPAAIAPGQRLTGALALTDSTSPVRTAQRAYRFSDLYRLTLAADTTVTIDMRSADFDGFGEILNPATGAVLFSDDDTGGSRNPRITANLLAGTYLVEVTSFSRRAVGNYTISVNMPVLSSITPPLRAVGTSASVTFAGNNFRAPMTLDAGADIIVGNVNVQGATAATALVSIGSSAALGPRNFTLTSPDGQTNAVPFRVLPALVPIALGQTVSGALSTTDPLSVEVPGSYADIYQLTITSTTAISIDLQSTAFDTVLFLLSASTGSVLAIDDDSGGNGNSRLLGTIGAGNYYLEVVSVDPASTGAYTLTAGQFVLSSVGPAFVSTSAPMNVTLTGNGFRSPLTIDAGAGVVASNISVVSSTTATATLTAAPGATLGRRSLKVTTPDGTTNAVTFSVVSSIGTLSAGQRLLGSLSVSDQASALRSSSYGDVYQMDLTGSTTLTIDLQSTAFDAYLYLLSSTGATLFADDQSGGSNNARIRTTVGPGTFYVLATSYVSGLGNYTLTAGVAPTFTLSTPAAAARGTVTGVTLTGAALFPPMTLTGDGLAISNVSYINATTAIATVAVDANASLGPRTLTLATPYGSATGVTFNVLAPQASQLNFPRLFPPTEMAGTGFALVNPSAAAADVTFTLYSAAGAVLGTRNATVPARGQLSRLGSELFGTPSVGGWVQATSTAVGLQSFWVGGNFTTVMDGAAAAPATRELVFPLVNRFTEINVANPGATATVVTLRVFSQDGAELASAVIRDVSPNGILSASAPALFPAVNFDGAPISIRASAPANIAGTSVTLDFPVAPSWTVINGIDTALSLLQVTFPHVPNGSQGGGPAWTSVLGISNVSPEEQTVTITFTPNSGSVLQVTRTIAGRGTLRVPVGTLFGFSSAYQEGWVKVAGTAPLNGFIAYGYEGTGGAAVVPSQGIAQATLLFSHVANGPLWGTGLALLNATATDATVQVYIMNPNGSLVGGADNVPTATFTLPAGTKTARLLTELVPAANSDGGFVFVRTTNNVPLYGIELFFSRDLRVIANVSAGAVDPSITYTPPTP